MAYQKGILALIKRHRSQETRDTFSQIQHRDIFSHADGTREKVFCSSGSVNIVLFVLIVILSYV